VHHNTLIKEYKTQLIRTHKHENQTKKGRSLTRLSQKKWVRTCGTCISKSAIQLITFNPLIKWRFLHKISTYLIKIGKKNGNYNKNTSFY